MTILRKLTYILLPALALAAAGCRDDFELPGGEFVEGLATVDMSVSYDLEDEVELSRAYTGGEHGTAIGNINTLSMFVYKSDGTLYDRYDVVGGTRHPDVSAVTVNNASDNTLPGETSADTSIGRVDFKVTIQSGRYYIYAVANVDEALLTPDKYATRDGLKAITPEWSLTDISKNAEMFGVFSLVQNRDANDSHTIALSADITSMHCWVRRLASKLTVAFDGSELYDNVQVYITDIQVHDIPRSCPLGNLNVPGRDAYGNELPRNRRSEFLHADGMAQHVQDIPENSGMITPRSFLHVCNGAHKNLGRGDENQDNDRVHSNTALSLFFYENAQGTGKRKVQSLDGTTIWKPNPDQNVEGSGWKDEKPFGTYVEVHGHYKATANDSNSTSGPIIYRFMLGNDTDTSYTVDRNTHYKLTLKLRGYANDYDWHIDYREPTGIRVSSPQYISYLHNKKMVATVRIIGEMDPSRPYVEAEIVAPNQPNSQGIRYWAPWGDNTLEGYPDPSGHTDPERPNDPNSYYYQGNVRQNGPWVSFLSLRESHLIRISPPGYDNGYSSGYTAADPLGYIKTFWRDHREGLRQYYYGEPGVKTNQTIDPTYNGYGSSQDGEYVVKNIRWSNDGTPVERTFNIPFFTRPKEIITSSGFSGANPYDSYPRNARVKLTAYVREAGSNGPFEETVQYVDFIQVRRVVNPMAIWRSSSNNESFHVTLMAQRQDKGIETAFEPVESYGDWNAEIMPGSGDIITLRTEAAGMPAGAAQQQGVKRIQSSAEKDITFHIDFNGNNGFAMVRVRYNNNSCEHDIFVRHGWESDVTLNGVTWASRNVEYFINKKAYFAETPLSEGSFFRRGSYVGIAPVNNRDFPRIQGTIAKSGYSTGGQASGVNFAQDGKNVPTQGPFKVYDGKSGTISGPKVTWDKLTGTEPLSNMTLGGAAVQAYNWNIANTDYQIADITDFYTLVPQRSSETDFEVQQAYGVLYGDGSTYTRTTAEHAFGYREYEADTHSYGVRGVMCYSRTNFAQVFFSLGAEGMARRKRGGSWRNNDPDGFLRYAARSNYFGFYSGDLASLTNLPLFMNLYRRPGGIYWCRSMVNKGVSNVLQSSAFDMNFFTQGFEGFINSACENGNHANSDAAPIRLVRK